jgi:tetratricopeptide (TPR) repeat protein
MKPRTAMILVAAACFFVACGPKAIKKRSVSPEARLEAIRLMGEGDDLFSEGKEHLAMLKYFEATRVNPYEEVAFNRLAIAQSRLGRYYQARRSVDRAIGLNREYARAYNTRGILYLVENDLKDASRSFRKAISIKPDVPGFYVNLGFTEVRRGNLDEAITAYEKANELQPDVFEKQDSLELDLGGPVDPASYYQLGLVFAKLGKLDLTIWYLEKAILAGFDDYETLASEPVLMPYKEEQAYQSFLERNGVS